MGKCIAGSNGMQSHLILHAPSSPAYALAAGIPRNVLTIDLTKRWWVGNRRNPKNRVEGGSKFACNTCRTHHAFAEIYFHKPASEYIRNRPKLGKF